MHLGNIHCGKHGEYHTLVTDGPLFRHALAFRPGVTHADGSLLLLDIEPGRA
jgi:diphthamide synthase (EF-2-diphthine--ammonia ligase)